MPEDLYQPVELDNLQKRRGVLWNLMAVDLGERPMPPEVAFPRPRRAAPGRFSTGQGPDLAIDFGTCAIAAALVGGHHAVEVLRFGDEELLAAPFGPEGLFPLAEPGPQAKFWQAVLAAPEPAAAAPAAAAPASRRRCPTARRRRTRL